MADLSAPGPSGLKLPTFSWLGLRKSLFSSDIGLAVGIMGIIVVLIVPLPPLLLDGLLASRSSSRC